MLRVGVLASGRGSNLAALLDAEAAGRLGAKVVVVVSDNRHAQALQIAKERGIKAVFVDASGTPREAYDGAIAKSLAAEGVGLVVLAGYMRIVTPVLLRAFPNKVINVHPSLLPAFPGLKAQHQAYAWGVRVTGCTTHFVTEEVDAGPVILQAAVPVQPDDTPVSLSERILAREHEILPESVRLFAEGRLQVEGRRVSIKGARPAPDGFVSPGGASA